MSAEERREAVVDIAVDEFAKRGLHGTPTEEIANKAGISHAYLFRLFPTKTDLFIAAMGRCFERVIETFAKAAEGVEKGERLDAMGQAYVGLLGDRTRLLSQLQGYAACEDPKVRKVVREHWAELYDFVARETGEDAERLREFFAAGMLLTITAAMDLLNHDEVWAERLLPAKS